LIGLICGPGILTLASRVLVVGPEGLPASAERRFLTLLPRLLGRAGPRSFECQFSRSPARIFTLACAPRNFRLETYVNGQ